MALLDRHCTNTVTEHFMDTHCVGPDTWLFYCHGLSIKPHIEFRTHVGFWDLPGLRWHAIQLHHPHPQQTNLTQALWACTTSAG